MGFSTGTTLGKGIAEHLATEGNRTHIEDFEKIKKFINKETGYRFATGRHDTQEMRIKAVAKCSSRR